MRYQCCLRAVYIEFTALLYTQQNPKAFSHGLPVFAGHLKIHAWQSMLNDLRFYSPSVASTSFNRFHH